MTLDSENDVAPRFRVSNFQVTLLPPALIVTVSPRVTFRYLVPLSMFTVRAVALAAALFSPDLGDTVVCVLSGGNVDPGLFAQTLARFA